MSTYTIEFISGLKPAGSNDFPLLQARHVAIDDAGTRLTDLLNSDIFPKQDVTVSEATDGVYIYSVPADKTFTLNVGSTYVVEWNGTIYSCVAKSLNDSEYATYIGNGECLGPLYNPTVMAADSTILDTPTISLVNLEKLSTPTIRLETETVTPDPDPGTNPDQDIPSVGDVENAPFAIAFFNIGTTSVNFYTKTSGTHSVRVYVNSINLLPVVSELDNGKVLVVLNGEWVVSEPSSSLPPVVTTDNGKILKVVNGVWAMSDPDKEMPEVTAEDNGKVMQVVDGTWQAVSLENSEIKTYIDTYISEALGGDY